MLVLPEGLENLQKAFGNFSRIENTAGVGGGVVEYSLYHILCCCQVASVVSDSV